MELGSLYWISYYDNDILEAFVGVLTNEDENYLELSRDFVVTIPKEFLDRVWLVS